MTVFPLVGREGFEPPAHGLKDPRSTIVDLRKRPLP